MDFHWLKIANGRLGNRICRPGTEEMEPIRRAISVAPVEKVHQ